MPFFAHLWYYIRCYYIVSYCSILWYNFIVYSFSITMYCIVFYNILLHIYFCVLFMYSTNLHYTLYCTCTDMSLSSGTLILNSDLFPNHVQFSGSRLVALVCYSSPISRAWRLQRFYSSRGSPGWRGPLRSRSSDRKKVGKILESRNNGRMIPRFLETLNR